jgi:hypothetical protein
VQIEKLQYAMRLLEAAVKKMDSWRRKQNQLKVLIFNYLIVKTNVNFEGSLKDVYILGKTAWPE